MKKLLLVISILMICASSSMADDGSGSSSEVQKPSLGKIPFSQLTPDEREILENGEISTGSYIAGGVVGTVFGLGIGQAIEGRYLPTGMIITVGEAVSFTLVLVGSENCIGQAVSDIGTSNTTSCNATALYLGIAGLIGFRIWEIVDVWASPPSINSRYRALKERVDGAPPTSFNLVPMPAIDARTTTVDGGELALQFKF